ncbi:hypothetical protein BBJ28_00015384 [Nothophytophthora sp. Chile5]|nr:hypothetical protein BBJ28_00015384 [Nothophytophthora sp. Chile5]
MVYQKCTSFGLNAIPNNGTSTIDASDQSIQAVSNFPEVTSLVLARNAITSIDGSDDAIVKTLYALYRIPLAFFSGLHAKRCRRSDR